MTHPRVQRARDLQAALDRILASDKPISVGSLCEGTAMYKHYLIANLDSVSSVQKFIRKNKVYYRRNHDTTLP